jgi:hypothetical protein
MEGTDICLERILFPIYQKNDLKQNTFGQIICWKKKTNMFFFFAIDVIAWV